MKKNKLISAAVLSTLTAASIYSINRIINLMANAKASISSDNGCKYEWRFGNIFYTKQGEGKPVLLIHELTCGSSDLEWKNIVKEYSKNHTVYTLDLLGCGRSDKPAFTYTNFLYVQMITDFVKNIIGKRTDVICTGSSVQFIVMACYNDDSLFDKIVMVNPESIVLSSQNIATNKKLTKLLIEMPLIGTTIFNIYNSMYSYKKLFEEQYFTTKIKSSVVKNYYDAAHYGTMTSKYLFASISANYTKINISTALKSINNSIIIVGGENEKNILQTCLEYQEYNSAIETCIIKNCKHLPQLEQPKSFLETINIYL
ncbi:MAG: alpha/beta fold hydrolase [Lachnospiraceae bacterium]|nr:alpha/beta fold hydrolase [Lachnospiraceae bacterium]